MRKHFEQLISTILPLNFCMVCKIIVHVLYGTFESFASQVNAINFMTIENTGITFLFYNIKNARDITRFQTFIYLRLIKIRPIVSP